MKDSKIEEKLNNLKTLIKPSKVSFSNFLDSAVTEMPQGRLVKRRSRVAVFWSYSIASSFVTMLILVGVLSVRNSNQEILSLDVTDLEYAELETSIELSETEWFLEEELSMLGIEIEEEVL